MPPDKCSDHTQLMVDIAEIKSSVKYLRDDFADVKLAFKEHIESSVDVRDNVKKNSEFRSGMTKIVWLIVTAVIGLGVKAIFF